MITLAVNIKSIYEILGGNGTMNAARYFEFLKRLMDRYTGTENR